MADTQRSVSPVILIVGGIAIVAASLYALWAFVLSGNSSTTTANNSAAPSASASAAVPGGGSSESADGSEGAQPTEGDGGVEGEAAPAPGEDTTESDGSSSQVLPETFEVYTARNPFEQLIRPREEGASSNGGTSPNFPNLGASVPGPGSSSGSSGSSGSTGGSASVPRPSTPVSPGQPSSPEVASPSSSPVAATTPGKPAGSGDTGNTSNSAGTGAGGQVEVGATRVRLQSVDDTKAVVTVNGVDYNPTVGEQFAQRFKLLSVNKASGKDCATMLFGDSRFSICAGQVIDK